MARQEKLTAKLDLRKRAAITGRKIKLLSANYSVDAVLDSGSLLVLTNASIPTFRMTLPAVALANGGEYHFLNRTLNGIELTSATNSIISRASVNATHGIKSVNISDTVNIGMSMDIWCDGTYHYLMPSVASNVGFQIREL